MSRAIHEKLELVGRGFVRGRSFAIPWGDIYYPALILDEVGYKVYGNLYEAKEDFCHEDLKKLDDYEEYYPNNLSDSEYLRQEVSVIVDGDKVEANVYVYNKVVPREAIEITDGDFTKFLNEI